MSDSRRASQSNAYELEVFTLRKDLSMLLFTAEQQRLAMWRTRVRVVSESYLSVTYCSLQPGVNLSLTESSWQIKILPYSSPFLPAALLSVVSVTCQQPLSGSRCPLSDVPSNTMPALLISLLLSPKHCSKRALLFHITFITMYYCILFYYYCY